MTNSFKELPASCRWFVGTVCMLGCIVLAYVGVQPREVPVAELMFFAALAAALSTWRVHMTTKLGTLSVGFAVVYAALINLGVNEAVLVGAVSAFAGTFRSSKTGKIQPAHRILYGVSIISLTAYVSGLLFCLADGQPGAPLFEMFIPVSISTAAYYFVNTVLVAIPIALTRGESVASTWKGLFLWTVPSYYAGTCCAVIMSMAYRKVGLLSAVLVTPPLYVVLYSYRLYIEKMEHELKHIQTLTEHSQHLMELYLKTIYSLVAAIDAKDRYTRDHSSRVQQYGVLIARQMNLSPDQVEAIRAGGLLHDIGKLGIPDYVLGKPGLLTVEEYNRIQQHPALGYEILRPLEFPWEVLPVVRSHHERYDGKGYPDGLKGEEIPLVARVLAVADVYDALTSLRPYRGPWTHGEAVDHIVANAGAQFDPTIVEAFTQVADQIYEMKKMSEHVSNTPAERARPFDEFLGITIGVSPQALNRISTAHQEMFALYEMAQIMGNALDLDQTSQLVLTKIMHAFGPCCGVIYLLDPEHGELVARKATGPHAEQVWLRRIRVGQGVSGQVIQTGEPMICIDGEHTSATGNHELEPPFRSAMSAPLIHNGEVLGALTCYHERPQAFTNEMFEILPHFARHAALAMYNAITLETMRQTAMTDHLTGLFNERYLLTSLQHETERSHRSDQQLSLMLVDLDGFRRVNDTYGHLAGDQILREFSAILRRIGREYDIPVRYRGDEFALLIPECDQNEALTLVAQLREALANHAWSPRRGHVIELGASIGLATIPQDASDADQLLQIADERMYRDKSNRKHENFALAS